MPIKRMESKEEVVFTRDEIVYALQNTYPNIVKDLHGVVRKDMNGDLHVVFSKTTTSKQDHFDVGENVCQVKNCIKCKFVVCSNCEGWPSSNPNNCFCKGLGFIENRTSNASKP